MSDISVTASAVQATSTTTGAQGTAGGSVTAGQPVYLNTSSLLVAAKADALLTSAAVGIAINNAASGQPLQYASGGDVTFNAVLTAGVVYDVSAAAAGGIAPNADMTTGNYVCVLGVATSTTNLKLCIKASSVAHG